MVIHIYGAAGSGTTTLGKALAEKLQFAFIDVDDYYWLETKIPFTKSRSKSIRVEMLKSEINKYDNCVISGAICIWGDELIPYLDLVIKLETPTPLRINRLKARESERFKSRIEKDGDMYENHIRFIEWASIYDTGGLDVRSNKLHNAWLKKINTKKLILDGSNTINELINEIIKSM